MTTTITIATTIEKFPAHKTGCPCGCGGSYLDRPATRTRLQHDTTGVWGNYVDVQRSIDGGANWFGGSWIPVTNSASLGHIAKLVLD